MMAAVPFASAVIIELVARKTSKTTHTVLSSLRPLRAAKSAGVKRTSRFFILA